MSAHPPPPPVQLEWSVVLVPPSATPLDEAAQSDILMQVASWAYLQSGGTATFDYSYSEACGAANCAWRASSPQGTGPVPVKFIFWHAPDSEGLARATLQQLLDDAGSVLPTELFGRLAATEGYLNGVPVHPSPSPPPPPLDRRLPPPNALPPPLPPPPPPPHSPPHPSPPSHAPPLHRC